MQTQTLTYEADGLQMVSHLYYEEQSDGRQPGVLVFPEAFGLGDHANSRAERLAGLGYVALACDLHGDGRMVTISMRRSSWLDRCAPSRLAPGRVQRLPSKPCKGDPGWMRPRLQLSATATAGAWPWSWREAVRHSLG